MQTTAKKQILVVEDEGIVAADLQGRLERLGYAVPAVAGSGRQALDLVRRQPFDLVLMDIRLKGGMDGISTAHALQRERDLPVVYVTAYADAKTIRRAKTTKVLGYIVKPVRDAALRSTIEISLDEYKRGRSAARELEEAEERCRALAGRLHAAKENECRRLARELHDDIQQRLTALALEMEIQDQESDLPPQSRTAMRSASLRLRQLCRDLHRLSHDLHPRLLQELGLVAALSRLCRGCDAQGLAVQFEHRRVPAVIPADMAVCLYRVAQEALQNVVKHAHVEKATLRLESTGKELVLRVTDRGAGFDPEIARQGSPIGLLSMSDRVQSVGGTLHLASRPGQGTAIRAAIPFAESPA